jgi:hypothetical protein
MVSQGVGNARLSLVSVPCSVRGSCLVKVNPFLRFRATYSCLEMESEKYAQINNVLHNCKVKSKFATAVTVQENKTMATTAEEDVNHLPIYKVDLKLEEFKDHFIYRMKRYLDQKRSIEKNEGSLEEFSKG